MSTSLVQAVDAATASQAATEPATGASAVSPGSSFSHWLLSRVDKANHDLVHADSLVREFAVDDSIPVHQVTYALEQSRISLEVMLQVRSRLVDAYQELFRMQL